MHRVHVLRIRIIVKLFTILNKNKKNKIKQLKIKRKSKAKHGKSKC